MPIDRAAGRAAGLAVLLLAACVPAPSHQGLAAPQPVFSAEQFFTGRTEGEAVLKVIFKAPHAVHVHGHGRVEPDGTLVLDQRIEEAGKAATNRQWRIRRSGPGRYTGTLTDAGPVTGEVTGNLLHLAFRSNSGEQFEQWLYLQPGGQVALNRMAVRKWGIGVAALTETIRRVE